MITGCSIFSDSAISGSDVLWNSVAVRGGGSGGCCPGKGIRRLLSGEGDPVVLVPEGLSAVQEDAGCNFKQGGPGCWVGLAGNGEHFFQRFPPRGPKGRKFVNWA